MPRNRNELVADLESYTDCRDDYLSTLLWEAADQIRKDGAYLDDPMTPSG